MRSERISTEPQDLMDRVYDFLMPGDARTRRQLADQLMPIKDKLTEIDVEVTIDIYNPNPHSRSVELRIPQESLQAVIPLLESVNLNNKAMERDLKFYRNRDTIIIDYYPGPLYD